MPSSFILRANERGFNKLPSTGPNASYMQDTRMLSSLGIRASISTNTSPGVRGSAESACSVMRCSAGRGAATTCTRTTTF
jgi:hypothetical protein